VKEGEKKMILRDEGFPEIIRKNLGVNHVGRIKKIFLNCSNSKTCVKCSNVLVRLILTHLVTFEAKSTPLIVQKNQPWRFKY
jgi:hypothetical protein